jgi:hypothetical protein
MGRNTKMKLAALATTLVATIGLVAASPATSASAGNGQTTSHYRGIDGCC